MGEIIQAGSIELDKEQPQIVSAGSIELDKTPPSPATGPTIQSWKGPSMIDRIFRLFEDPEKERARATQALVDSQALGISPSQAYRYRDQIDEGVKINPEAAAKRATLGQRVKQSFDIGVKQNQVGELGYQYIITGDPKYLDAINRIGMPGANDVYLSEGKLETAFRAAAKMLPMMADTAAESTHAGLSTGMAVAGAVALLGQAGPQAALPEEIVTVPAAFATGFTAGAGAKAFEATMRKEAGLALSEIITLKDADGKPIDPGIARAASFGIGVINGAIEVAQIRMLVKTIPGLSNILSKALIETVADKTVKEKLIGLASAYAKTVTAETGQEVAQESTNIVFEELAKRVNNNLKGTKLDPTTVDAVVQRLYGTAVESAQAFSVFVAPGSVMKAGVTLIPTRQAAPQQTGAQVNTAAPPIASPPPGLAGVGRFESGGSYTAEHPVTGAYGKYQIMPSNWGQWAKEAGLPDGAKQTAENQEIVAQFKYSQYLDRFGGDDQLAATAWFAGPGAAARLANGDMTVLNRKDANGVTVADYIRRTTGREFGTEATAVSQGPAPVNIEEVIRRAVETDEDINTIIDDAFGSVESDNRVDMALQNQQNAAAEDVSEVERAITLIPGTNEVQSPVEMIPQGVHPVAPGMAREAFAKVKGVTVDERADGTYIKGANGATGQADANLAALVVEKAKAINETIGNKGSIDLTPIVELGRSIWQEGHQTVERFTTRAKEVLGDAWEKVKDLIRQAWDVINNESGKITVKGPKQETLESYARKHRFNFNIPGHSNKEAIENGLFAFVKNDAIGIDKAAEELQGRGLLGATPEGYATAGDYLYDELKRIVAERAKEKMRALTSEEEKAIIEVREELRKDGYNEREIEKSLEKTDRDSQKQSRTEIADRENRLAEELLEDDVFVSEDESGNATDQGIKGESKAPGETGAKTSGPVQIRSEKELSDSYNQAEAQATAELKALLAKAEKALASAQKNNKQSAIEKAAEKVKSIKARIREITGQTRRTGEEKTVTEYSALKAAFTKAAQAAREAYRSGNKEGIEKAKQEMKAAVQAARDKRQAADKRQSDIDAIMKLSKMKGSIAVDYQKRIRDLMSDFDPKNVTAEKWAQLQSLQEYIDRNGVPLGINPKRLAELKRLTDIPLKSLTDEQLAMLRQQLELLTELGKLKAKMKYKYNERRRNTILNKILATTVNLDPSVAFDKGQLGHFDKLKVAALSFYLNTLHTPRVADMADGRMDYKGEQAKLVRSMGEGETAAVTNATKRQQGWLDWLKENNISLPEEDSESDIRMMIVIRVREGAMKAAQNLMDKHGIKEVPVLTPEEEAIVGYIRDDMERNKAKLAATWEEINGEIFPEQKVYYLPLKYEGEEEILPEAQTEGRGRTVNTFDGFSHKRRPNVDKIPRAGIARVYHEATMEQEWFTGIQPVIEDIKSVVLTPDYKAEAGQVLYDWWKTQLDIMARRGWMASAQMNAVSKALASFRHNIASATLAFKLPTVIMQPFAVFDAMAFVNGQLGPVAAAKVAGAVAESFLRPGWTKGIIANSAALQQRAAGELAIQEELARLDSSFLDKAKKVGFDLIQWTDLKTAAGVQEQVRKILIENGIDETQAKADAEFAMHMSQGSTSVAYRPHILAQGEAARTWFTFQNFVLNRWGILIHDVVMGKIVHGDDFKARFLGVISLGLLVAGGMAEDEARRKVRQLYSNPKEDKRNIFEQIVVNTLGLVPFFGNFITAASQKYTALPPTASHAQKMFEGAFTMAKGKDAKAKVKGGVKMSESLLTLLFGIPGTGQVYDLVEGVMSDGGNSRNSNARRR